MTNSWLSRWLAVVSLMAGTVVCYADIPGLGGKKKGATEQAPAASVSTDPTRVVAKVNGEEITREQLANELIEIYGKEHLDSMVGRLLVQQQCRAKNVEVTEVDVRKELEDILRRNNLKLEEFRNQVLASQNMTLGQYLRDQVWPRLALVRLVKDQVKVTDEDLAKAFEANFGEKVDVRMMTVVERRKAEEVWKQVSETKTLEERVKTFEDLARRYSTDEATRPYGGKAVPIGHNTVNEEFEKTAFELQAGDLGSIMQVPGGHLLLLCVARIEPRKDITLDSKVDPSTLAPTAPKKDITYREVLSQDIEQKKILQEVGVYYQQIEKQADIQNFLTGEFDAKSVVAPKKEPNTVDPTAARPGPGRGN